MELKESTDRWLKAGNFDEYNSLDEVAQIENGSAFTYELPAPKSRKKNGLMLDLDSRDGKWLIAGAKKKYIPIGVSGNLDSATLSLLNVRKEKTPGYVVIADINANPFQRDLFDLVWNFSPYNANQDSLHAFAETISQVLAKSGILKIAFDKKNQHQYFQKHLAHVHRSVHTYFGEIALKENLQNGSASRKFTALGSMAIAYLSRIIPTVNNFANTIYINAIKNSGTPNFRIHHFLKHHWLKQNLNIVYLLQCPISGGSVYLSKDSNYVISDLAKVKYPVINEIPVMLKKAAIDLDSNKTAREAISLLQA